MSAQDLALRLGGDGDRGLARVREKAAGLRRKLETTPQAPKYLVSVNTPGARTTPRGSSDALQLLDLSPGARNLPALAAPPPATLAFLPGGASILWNGNLVGLSPRTFRLLNALVTRPGQAATSEKLEQLVREAAPQDRQAPLRTLVQALRGKLEANPSSPIYLLTDENVDGEGHRGYRLHAQLVERWADGGGPPRSFDIQR
jgi:DNA-binding winged helix-turn-helix (wHTH) protein